MLPENLHSSLQRPQTSCQVRTQNQKQTWRLTLQAAWTPSAQTASTTVPMHPKLKQ